MVEGGGGLLDVGLGLFLHLIWSVVRVDDPRDGQLLLPLVLRRLLDLGLAHVQVEIRRVVTTVLLRGKGIHIMHSIAQCNLENKGDEGGGFCPWYIICSFKVPVYSYSKKVS